MTTPKNPPKTIEERLLLLEKRERARVANERRKAFKDSLDARLPKTTTLPPEPPLPPIGPRVGTAAGGMSNEQRQYGGDGGLQTHQKKAGKARQEDNRLDKEHFKKWYVENKEEFQHLSAPQILEKAGGGRNPENNRRQVSVKDSTILTWARKLKAGKPI